MVGEEGIVEANMAPSSPPGLAIVWITIVASPIMMYLRASLLLTCFASSEAIRNTSIACLTMITNRLSIYLSYRSDTSRWFPRGKRRGPSRPVGSKMPAQATPLVMLEASGNAAEYSTATTSPWVLGSPTWISTLWRPMTFKSETV